MSGLDLEQLVVKHLPRLEAFVRRQGAAIITGRESVSDLVQSAGREALVHGEGLEFDGEGKFVTWLYRVAMSKLVQKRRYHLADKRNVQLERDITVGDCFVTLGSPATLAEEREEADRIAAAFDQLSQDYQEAILRRSTYDMSYAEIAELTGKSEDACRQLVRRARARLAILIGMAQPGD